MINDILLLEYSETEFFMCCGEDSVKNGRESIIIWFIAIYLGVRNIRYAFPIYFSEGRYPFLQPLAGF